MAKPDDITTTGIAVLFDINQHNLRACIDAVPGFPKPVWRGAVRIYSLAAIQAWADGIEDGGGDPSELIRGAYRQHQAAHRYGDVPSDPVIASLQKDFAVGRFMTDEQKQAFEARRLAAGSRQNRQRVIQRIRPDWY